MSTPNTKDRLVISYILALIVVLNLEVSLKPTVSNLIDLDAASQARVWFSKFQDKTHNI